MLRIYLRLLRYLLPYWRRVVLALGAIVIYALLSGVSVTLVVPFLDNLFQQGPAAPTAMERVGGEVERSLNDASPHVARAKAWKDAQLAAVRAWLDRGGHGERLQRVLVIIFLAFLLKNLFGYLETYLVNWLEQRVLLDMRQHLYGHLQGLPLAFLGRQKTGVLMSRLVNDVNTLRGAIIGATATLLRNGLMIAVFLAIIFEVNWSLALATILIVPPNAWLMRRLGRLLRRDSTLIQERMGEMAGLIQETMTGARVVKAFGREADETRRFGRFNRQYFLSAIRLRALGALNAPMSEMLGTLSVVIIVGWGGHQVLQGRWPASHLVLFVTAVLSIAGPLRKISELNQQLQEGTAAGTRVFALLDEPGEHADLATGDAPGPLREAIRYERVGFAYNAGEPVLRAVDLEIPRGAVVALVGPSGGGKSTLADLLARFYEPTEGRIAMDGRDAREFNLAKWRAKMGIVTQDVVLFNDTIYANIAYGRPGASREEVEAAAAAALAADFIARAPAGYDTVIGERGLQLSGGERQRLAIARAILRDPEILIFDEATSALDTESERLVQAAIERLMEGRTTLVIAHRLSTIRRADRIVAVQGGRIVEQGTHEELLAAGGLYRQLYDMQFAEDAGPA